MISQTPAAKPVKIVRQETERQCGCYGNRNFRCAHPAKVRVEWAVLRGARTLGRFSTKRAAEAYAATLAA
jgi:hypothetical protein